MSYDDWKTTEPSRQDDYPPQPEIEEEAEAPTPQVEEHLCIKAHNSKLCQKVHTAEAPTQSAQELHEQAQKSEHYDGYPLWNGMTGGAAEAPKPDLLEAAHALAVKHACIHSHMMPDCVGCALGERWRLLARLAAAPSDEQIEKLKKALVNLAYQHGCEPGIEGEEKMMLCPACYEAWTLTRAKVGEE